MTVDKGAHMLLGEPPRADGQEHGECAWTLLTDSMWDAPPFRITRLERMTWPAWMKGGGS